MATNIRKRVRNLIKKHKTRDVWELAKLLDIKVVLKEMKPLKCIVLHSLEKTSPTKTKIPPSQAR